MMERLIEEWLIGWLTNRAGGGLDVTASSSWGGDVRQQTDSEQQPRRSQIQTSKSPRSAAQNQLQIQYLQ